MSDPLDPFLLFNFEVTFAEWSLSDGRETGAAPMICSAAFSEVTGLEATMEPKVIKEGGRNFGPVQRCGPVTFATVVLKRGVTRQRDLFNWFKLVGRGEYARRLNAYLRVRAPDPEQTLYVWRLNQALPIKFKAADLNATASNVGVEELHLAHEGLELVEGGAA
jgi:phage tail-like protein